MQTKTIHRAPQGAGAGQRGGALLIAIIAVIVLAGMTTAMLTISTANQRESRSAVDRMRALYIAESGLSRGLAALEADAPQAVFGAPGAPVAFSGGGFWGSSVDNGDGTWTITSFGTADGLTRGIEAVIVGQEHPIYSNALFAGNSSEDPLYSLDLGGCGAEADLVDGPVYSGNDIDVVCDADITGKVRANGTITGMAGTEGLSQPIPDIPGMNYELNHDFDVATMFGAAALGTIDGGGTAYQLPEDSPAHIFRKNPDDRSSDTSATTKDDYFIEDPYEPFREDNNQNGTDAYHVTISGNGGEHGPNGNEKVYYIDGNLWLHNKGSYSFKLYTNGEFSRITFVVKGNIYFSDNLFYQNKMKDAVAFIAMEDDAVPDSGNIYFGDPVFGTLEHMDAFMYAENNFYDNNLDAQGSKEVEVFGNMTAGNQVLINRDFEDHHSKLTVEWDQRILNSNIELPGLPTAWKGQTSWSVGSWREIAVP